MSINPKAAPVLNALDEAIAWVHKTGSGNAPTDRFERVQYEMSGAHAVVLNGLRSVYAQATDIPVEKHQDFVGYCLQWIAYIEEHHDWEEAFYFPLFPSGSLSPSIVEEHAQFHDGIVAAEKYLTSCLPLGTFWGFSKQVLPSASRPEGSETLERFDGEAFRRIIEGFVDPLIQHLVNELGYLSPSNLHAAAGLTDETLAEIGLKVKKYMMKLPAQTALTYTVLHVPAGSNFPPAPNFIKTIFVPYIFYWYGRKWWQFAPSK